MEVTPGVRLLRFAMIYGANASGKSNLLRAFDFLRYFWFNSQTDINDETEVIPFLLDQETPNKHSNFELIFYVGDKKYDYVLELDKNQIYYEKLSFYTSVQPTMLFERSLNDSQSVIKFNPSVVKISSVAKEKISIECLKNMSFFAARDKVNISIPEIDDAKNWMKKHIMPTITSETDLYNFAERKSHEDNTLKQYILNFLKEADYNITNISSEIIKKRIPDDYLEFMLNNDNVPKQEKERLKTEKTIQQINTSFEHTVHTSRGIEKYLLPSFYESTGTLRTFGIETVIYNLIKSESFLSIDEIETSLHPQLLKYILLNFLREKSRSQLIISTHYDPLLNEIDEIFRKDSVWFTEKNNSGHSELYSLIEFNGLNRLSSIQKAYNNGKFGAFPEINF